MSWTLKASVVEVDDRLFIDYGDLICSLSLAGYTDLAKNLAEREDEMWLDWYRP
jgi:hypothetical protein